MVNAGKSILHRIICSIMIVCMFLASWGCMSFHTLTQEEVRNLPVDETLVVNMENRIQYDLEAFYIAGDSLKGRWNETSVRFDLSRVESMGIRKVDPIRTVLFCGLGIAGAILIIGQFNKSAYGGDESENKNPGGPGDNE